MFIKSILLAVSILFFVQEAVAQNKIEWSPDIVIQLSDYQSASTEIDENLSTYSVRSGAMLDFAFSMSYYEFMLTKNFNKKVTAIFDKNASYISAPSIDIANQLVNFGGVEFDLAELSARKFRKKLFESKGAFTNTNFFKPLFDEAIAEQLERYIALGKSTDMGRNSEVLVAEREKIRQEIEVLSDYCKTCKPPKKRRKKK